MIRKQKRATITQNGRAHIIKRALQRPRIPRTKLAEQLQGELEAMGHDVPEIEVLERKISWYRNHETDDPQDKPWSMATLDDYPIPPEALPKVFKLSTKSEMQEHLMMITFTIRDAKWAARLSGFFDDLSELLPFAAYYSVLEKMANIQGLDFDSTDIDEILGQYLKGNISITEVIEVFQGFMVDNYKLKEGKL